MVFHQEVTSPQNPSIADTTEMDTAQSLYYIYIFFGFLVIIFAVVVVAVIQKFKYFQNNVVYTIIMYNYCSLRNRIVVSLTEL